MILLVSMSLLPIMAAAEETRTIEVEFDNIRQITDVGHSTNFYAGYVEVGRNDFGISRAIYGGNFEELTRTDIVEAIMALPRYMEYYQIGNTSNYTLSIHRIEEPWNYWNKTITSKNMPAINLSNGVIGEWVINPNRGVIEGKGTDIAEMMPVFDVTELLMEGPRYGFVVKLTDESGENARSVFCDYKENSPILKVIVSGPGFPEMKADRNNNGLFPSDYLQLLEESPIPTSELNAYDKVYTAEFLEVHMKIPYPPGDFNKDYSVDFRDYEELLEHIDNNNPYDPIMDLNDDGFVTIEDRDGLLKTNTLPFLAIPPPIEAGDFNNNGFSADCEDWFDFESYWVRGEATDDDVILMYDIARRASYMKGFGDLEFRKEADLNLDKQITIADHMLMREYTLTVGLPSEEMVSMATVGSITDDSNVFDEMSATKISFSFSTEEVKENNKGGKKSK